MARPVRIPLHRQAQQQLKDYIGLHGLRPGDPLPSEAALADELGISRLSLREAVKSLESVGILETRHGRGLFVRPFSFEPIFQNLPYSFVADGASLRHLLQVREALEAGLIGMVADRIAPADLEALDTLAEEMAAHAARGEPIVDPDRRFHLRLFQSLDNPMVQRLIELFWETFHRLRAEVVPEPSDPRRVHHIHTAIVEALRSGDRAQAVAAMTDHFSALRSRVDGYSGTDQGR